MNSRDEPAIVLDAVFGGREGGRAAEAGEVRHDEPHLGELVGHPEQAMVVAAETVDDQDGPRLRVTRTGS